MDSILSKEIGIYTRATDRDRSEIQSIRLTTKIDFFDLIKKIWSETHLMDKRANPNDYHQLLENYFTLANLIDVYVLRL